MCGAINAWDCLALELWVPGRKRTPRKVWRRVNVRPDLGLTPKHGIPCKFPSLCAAMRQFCRWPSPSLRLAVATALIAESAQTLSMLGIAANHAALIYVAVDLALVVASPTGASSMTTADDVRSFAPITSGIHAFR